MGILHFQQHIKKTYPSACATKWLNQYDNLYIDLNHVLHFVCAYAKTSTDMTMQCIYYIEKLIDMFKPKKRIFLLADGSAPLAKLLKQRNRRLQISKRNNTTNVDEKLQLHLTSGTQYMSNLEYYMNEFIEYIRTQLKLQVILSINEPNEGEIKIKNKLIDLQDKYPQETHLIYSADSDVILILFTCKDLTKIYQKLKDTIINYGELYNSHINLYGETKTAKNDFVFLNLMMGNDYLPKVKIINLNSLWYAYKTLSSVFNNGLVSYVDETVHINKVFLYNIFHIVSNNCKKNQSILLNKLSLSLLTNKYYYDYVTGLYWCFDLYMTGKCVDYNYIYNGKSLSFIGITFTIMSYHSYKPIISKPIDLELYNILLIPEHANYLLNNEQKIIANQLVEKYPVLYEEERCITCNNFLNSQRKFLMNKKELMDTMSCELESEYPDYENISICSIEKSILNGKKLNVFKEYIKHKETHITINEKIINEISLLFNECKNKSKLIKNNNNNISSLKFLPKEKRKIKTKLFKH